MNTQVYMNETAHCDMHDSGTKSANQILQLRLTRESEIRIRRHDSVSQLRINPLANVEANTTFAALDELRLRFTTIE